MKFKGKMLFVLALIVIFTFSLPVSALFGNDDEKVKINIFQFKVEVKEALEDAAERYMKENSDVIINIQTVGGGDDYGAALKSKFVSGKEPAIFNVGGPQDVKDWMQKLEDLSNESWVDLAYNGVLDGVKVYGKVYGMPFNQEGYGFIYNKSIFKKAGINADSIRSYEDLVAAVKKLDAKKDELGLKAVFAFPAKETWVTGLHLLNVSLANEFDNVLDAYNSKKVEFKYADSLKKIVDLQANYGYKTDGTKGSLNAVDYSTQVEELFSLEQVAIIQQGNWAYGSIAGIDKEVASNIGLLPIPLDGVKEDSIPVGIPMYWAINKDKDEKIKKASKDFLNWLYTSDEGKNIVINKFNFIPALKGYNGEGLEPNDPLAKDILKYSNEGRTMPWVFMGFPSGWGMNIFGANLQSYFTGDMSWNEVIEKSKEEWTAARK